MAVDGRRKGGAYLSQHMLVRECTVELMRACACSRSRNVASSFWGDVSETHGAWGAEKRTWVASSNLMLSMVVMVFCRQVWKLFPTVCIRERYERLLRVAEARG